MDHLVLPALNGEMCAVCGVSIRRVGKVKFRHNVIKSRKPRTSTSGNCSVCNTQRYVRNNGMIGGHGMVEPCEGVGKPPRRSDMDG